MSTAQVSSAISATNSYGASSLLYSQEQQEMFSQEMLILTSSGKTDKAAVSGTRVFSGLPMGNKDSFITFYRNVVSLEIDDDELPISNYALEIALYTTAQTFAFAGNKWKTPRVSTDGGGGLRLTWRVGEKELRAVIPAIPRHTRYLYIEHGDFHKAINNFTSMTLYEQFTWVSSSNG